MRYIKRITLIFIGVLMYVLSVNFWITYSSKPSIYDEISKIPKNKVGLILGVGKYTSNHRINLYYLYRLEAAYSLYKQRKIEYILISGDNGRKGYDEPMDFKNDLILKGVPKEKIVLDYAGFRTLDSIIRAKKIFNLESFTIISQKFHNERALYLARHFDLNAIAFNAKDIKGRYGYKTKLRELAARTKASLDLLFNKQPKFLGEQIDII